MAISLDDLLQEDSEDFSDDDAQSAVATRSVDDVVAALTLSCASCGERLVPSSHALRRRTGGLFWKVLMKCLLGHEKNLVFTADWLRGA